ncbi:dihydrofolate reductase family protein [Kitasatospora sp. NPDC059571]|uniref:dihydrofolate reductase family protein n=1 Tax=Kitasatospora sp. NPDC059571 TaxID=3346871 RepID=UPI0036AC7706
MRKIVMMMSVSLDGYFEGPERQIDWHRVDDELHRHLNDHLRTAGAFLSGRTTYELMASVWPTADADPANTGPVAEFAGIWRDMPKIVFSRTLEEAGWNTTILREVVVEDMVALKSRPGGELVLGGAELAASFRRLDLIDEYRIYVHPVLIGRGRSAFPVTGRTSDLRLLENRSFGNGVVLLRYERTGAAAGR